MPTGARSGSEEARALHTTMQTLGRFALILGTVAVAALNITMFSGIEAMDRAGKREVYATIYLARWRSRWCRSRAWCWPGCRNGARGGGSSAAG